MPLIWPLRIALDLWLWIIFNDNVKNKKMNCFILKDKA